MGLRFSKRITLFPGLRLNLGLGGASLSAGPRGASMTIGKSGIHGNVGIPGTGLSYRTRLDRPERRNTQDYQEKPTKPLAPPQFTLRFAADEVAYLDDDGREHSATTIKVIKAAYREQLLDALKDRVTTLNALRQNLASPNLETPRPAQIKTPPRCPLLPFSVPKPIRPTQSCDLPNFMEELSRWQVGRAEYECNTASDIDLVAIAEPVLARLSVVQWPRETNIDLDLDTAGQVLILDVDLPEIEDMPTEDYVLDSRGLSIRAKVLGPSIILRDYANHVHAVVFRIAGEAFAAQGCLTEIRVSAYTQRTSQANGQLEDVYVIASRITREQWDTIDFNNLEQIDPKAALEAFELKRKLNARNEFSPIVPLDRTLRET